MLARPWRGRPMSIDVSPELVAVVVLLLRDELERRRLAKQLRRSTILTRADDGYANQGQALERGAEARRATDR